jgi:hypothetical protein
MNIVRLLKGMVFFPTLIPLGASAFTLYSSEITYRCLDSTNARSYEIIVATYSQTDGVDRCEVLVSFGDGEEGMAERINGNASASNGTCPGSQTPLYCNHCGEMFQNNIKKNVYVTTHTYAQEGNFIISLSIENRNSGVCNIPNSVNVSFYNQAALSINPLAGINSSPVYGNAPLDISITGNVFKHNAFLTDPDGDSLAYSITQCRGINGMEIPGNPGNLNFSVNPATGDFIFDAPAISCIYNFALLTEDWRINKEECKPVLMGYTVRDFQIDVASGNNSKPEIDTLPSLEITAGDTLSLVVSATDFDADSLVLLADVAILNLDNVSWEEISSESGQIAYGLKWPTTLADKRCLPYYFYFKAEDDGGEANVLTDKLADYKTLEVRVGAADSCNCLTGMQEQTEHFQISFFPNPTSKQIQISYSNPSYFNRQLYIINGIGQTILTLKTSANRTLVDVSGLVPGLYFLKTDKGETAKVVVER